MMALVSKCQLYGWQKSGMLWEQHLHDSLVSNKTEDERIKEIKASIEVQAIETQHQLCSRISNKMDGWQWITGLRRS